MKRNLVLVLLVVLISLVAVIPAFAHNAGPCEGTDDPGHSEYAEHHIAFLAKNGDIGQVEHDGDDIAHTPGSHHGFSACNPSGN